MKSFNPMPAAWLLAALLAFSALHAEDSIDDAAALAGLEEAQGLFYVNLADPNKTALYLKVIDGTYQRFVEQGVEPDFVLVFVGRTVQFLTTEPPGDLALEAEQALESIRASVEQLSERGVRMEVCAVATGQFDVDNETILPQMQVVQDGFVSAIGWQNQGYRLVPIF